MTPPASRAGPRCGATPDATNAEGRKDSNRVHDRTSTGGGAAATLPAQLRDPLADLDPLMTEPVDYQFDYVTQQWLDLVEAKVKRQYNSALDVAARHLSCGPGSEDNVIRLLDAVAREGMRLRALKALRRYLPGWIEREWR